MARAMSFEGDTPFMRVKGLMSGEFPSSKRFSVVRECDATWESKSAAQAIMPST